MANLIRTAKSGSNWTTNDLLDYNIKVSSLSAEHFYGQPLPTVESLNSVDPKLFSGTLGTEGLSIETYRLLQYFDLASRANSGQDSVINDFAKETLRVLGYEKHGLLLRSRYAIPLLISGDPNQSLQTDVCLVQGSTGIILMVIQEDSDNTSVRDPEPQIIAEAIAAYQTNNRIRARLREPELDSMTIPCIAMIGTRPIFYLVPVTDELSKTVATVEYQRPSTTMVEKCVVVSNSRRLGEGMETPSFRQVALRHYIAFRTLAEAHWPALMIPGA
jgi:hypothetical protein